jgi:hypothetical protein
LKLVRIPIPTEIHLSSSALIVPAAYALGTVVAIPATNAMVATAAKNIFLTLF